MSMGKIKSIILSITILMISSATQAQGLRDDDLTDYQKSMVSCQAVSHLTEEKLFIDETDALLSLYLSEAALVYFERGGSVGGLDYMIAKTASWYRLLGHHQAMLRMAGGDKGDFVAYYKLECHEKFKSVVQEAKVF